MWGERRREKGCSEMAGGEAVGYADMATWRGSSMQVRSHTPLGLLGNAHLDRLLHEADDSKLRRCLLKRLAIPVGGQQRYAMRARPASDFDAAEVVGLTRLLPGHSAWDADDNPAGGAAPLDLDIVTDHLGAKLQWEDDKIELACKGGSGMVGRGGEVVSESSES